MLVNQSCSNSVSGTILSDAENTQLSESAQDKIFTGTNVMEEMSIWEHVETYWKFFFSKEKRTPLAQLPMEKVALPALLAGDGDQLKVAWLGHSSLLINIDGYKILTDPLLQRKISVVGPTRFHNELPLNGDELPAVDAVIISHDHYDHLNKYSIQKLIDKAGLFVVPLGVGARLAKWGVPEEKVVELRWWQEHSLDNNLTIAATPAQHFSGRGLFDRNKTLWASWAILTKKHQVFFSGDSGYFDGFKEIGDKYGPFDMTFIECGAYNKSWPKVHMFPEQTVQAHQDLGGKVLQPIHWATFNLSLHDWYEPMERLVSQAWKEGVKLSLPVVGKTVNSHDLHTPDLWWQPLMELSINMKKREGRICTTNQGIKEIL